MTTSTHFIVTVDTRFPSIGDQTAYKAVSLDGVRFMGWWSLAQFHEWASTRCAAITPHADGSFGVVAPLTQSEGKRANGYSRR